MDLMTQYILSAVLFVLGLAAIGAATFGRKRNRRILLAVAGIALWALTLVLYSQAVATSTAAARATTPTAPVAGQPTEVLSPTEETQVPEPTATPSLDLVGRIVFHSSRSGTYQIWSMNADGSDLRQLTFTEGRGDIEPDWSPDGKTIVFSSSRDDQDNLQLYLMDADGSNQRPLVDYVAADHLGARWSPNGEWIVLFSNDGGNIQVYKVRPDGTDLTNLSDHPSNNYMPYWSPDGQRIVFVSERDGNRELYVMDADGGNQVRLTDSFYEDVYPRWSPDGTTILLQSARDGLANLYLMEAPDANVTGPIDQDLRLVTFPGYNDSSPAWAGEGEYILFSSDRGSESGIPNWDLYAMTADGSRLMRLTDDKEIDRFPSWTP